MSGNITATSYANIVFGASPRELHTIGNIPNHHIFLSLLGPGADKA